MEEMDGTTAAKSADPRPEPAPERSPFRTVAIVVGLLLLLALIGLAGWGLVSHPLLTSVLRDIFIIVLALVTIIIGLFLVILIFQLQSLIVLLRDEVKPILESANQTASTVKGTTTFVSDSLVKPMIEAASVAAGVGRSIRVLAGTGQKKRRTRSRGAGRE